MANKGERRNKLGNAATRAAFLDALIGGETVFDAAKSAGTSPTSVYRWRKNDLDFAEDWDNAFAAGGASLVREAKRRAVHGVEEPVFYLGKQVASVRKYSDTLLIFLIKARDPMYCDRSRALDRDAARAKREAAEGDDLPALRKEAAEALARLDKLMADKAATAAGQGETAAAA